MEQDPVILDISSDEESAFDEPKGDVDYTWLSELLCDDVDMGDSDDVVVVGEIKSKSSSKAITIYENDDDCVVLDGDPDKPVKVVNDHAASDEDDLLIVGHKGQVACRDYPHPRHLCAKFPFGSTAHEAHCDLCHCYVCDSLAPCAHWCSGVSISDHCHATEKEDLWKSMRKSFRLQKDAPLPITNISDTSTTFPKPNQAPPLDIIRLTQNHVSRPSAIRACSSSTRSSIPNSISQSRDMQSGSVCSKSGFPSRIVSQQSQLYRVRNNAIRRDRVLNAGSILFKRAAGVSASATNQSLYGSSTNTRGALASHYTQNLAPQALSNVRNRVGLVPNMNQNSCTNQSTSQAGTGSVFASRVPTQPQVYSQSIPQAQVHSQPIPQSRPQVHSQAIPQSRSQVRSQLIPQSQPQVHSQATARPQVHSQPVPQPQVQSQPIPQFQVHSQPFPQSQVHSQSVLQSQVHSQPTPQPQAYSQPILQPPIYSQSCPEPQVYSQPIPQPQVNAKHIPQSNDGQNMNCLGNRRQNTVGLDLFDFDEWVNNINQNNQQSSVGNYQLHGTNEPLPVKELNSQCNNGNAKLQFNDLGFENWYPENQSGEVAAEGYPLSNLDVVSPELATFDAAVEKEGIKAEMESEKRGIRVSS